MEHEAAIERCRRSATTLFTKRMTRKQNSENHRDIKYSGKIRYNFIGSNYTRKRFYNTRNSNINHKTDNTGKIRCDHNKMERRVTKNNGIAKLRDYEYGLKHSPQRHPTPCIKSTLADMSPTHFPNFLKTLKDFLKTYKKIIINFEIS